MMRLLTCLCFLSMLVLPASAQARPNILFIYTDDQADWALGGGHPDAWTPNMDRLASESVRLTNSFVTTPVCSPSRLGLLTSRYGTELGITDWISPRPGHHRADETHLGLPDTIPTWVARLQDAGYHTGLVGKWHLGIQDHHHPTRYGYDYFYGFREGGAKPENPILEVDGEDRETEGLTVDVLTDAALKWLERQEGATSPFMLSLHYRAPHGPYRPVGNEEWAHFKDVVPETPEPTHPDLDVETMRTKLRDYLACVASIDRNLGRILSFLDEAGLRENTIVVFTSDHGYNIGHHGIIHKGNATWLTNAARNMTREERRRPNMFDTSLRVPTLISWPGVTRGGTTLESVFTNMDWYPTLLAMVGLYPQPGATIRGRDFSPRLRGAGANWRDEFYGEYSMHHYADADLRMIRTPEWKLVRDFREPERNALYRLSKDPLEEKNLYGKWRWRKVQADLEAQLLEKMRKIHDPVMARMGLSN